MGDGLEHGSDVGEDTEERGRGEHAHREHEEDLRLAENAELVEEARAGGFLFRHEEEDGDSGDEADGDDGPEGGSPAEGLAEGGAGGNSEDVGEGEAGEHEGDGLGSLITWDEVGGNDAAYAEEGSVTKGGEDASGEEQVVAGSDGAGEIAESEDAHEEQQRHFALEAGGGDGDERRSDGDGEGVAGDERSSLGDADLEAVRQVGEEPHDDELGGANAEGGDGERHERCAGEDVAGFCGGGGGCLHVFIATQVEFGS